VENDAALEEDAIESVRQAVAGRRARIRALQDQIDGLLPELRRYERALAYLTDQPINYKSSKRMSTAKPKAPRGTTIGEDRYATISEEVFAYAREHEEFRQLDIRAINGISSSVSSQIFERMRQENLLRIARQDGNNKFYRLTREGLARLDGPVGSSRTGASA
jgi:hypothetical protein